MTRHISVFTFKDGPEKAANIATVKAFLEKVPELYPAVRSQYLREPAAETPDLPEDAPVMFGDLIQVADFDTVEDASNYPASQAHIQLAEFSTPMLKKVTVIDYEV